MGMPDQPRSELELARLVDSELVRLAREGSASALRLIVRRHNRRLYRVARAIVRDDLHDGEQFWMSYRRRRPRGVEAERGWRCAVAKSQDGVRFEDVWHVHKDELKTTSMERFCLFSSGPEFQLFLSYVDPQDNRWRIDMLAASEPGAFDIKQAVPVLTAASTGTEGVKDPYVLQIGPVTYLFTSYAEARPGMGADAHTTADIYNVGATTHPSGVATSLDGKAFGWQDRHRPGARRVHRLLRRVSEPPREL
jgi:hypothetical protein